MPGFSRARHLQSAKRKLLILFLWAVLIFLPIAHHSSLITAQTEPALKKAQTDYNFQFTKYRDAREEYETAKAAYLSFKTAIAKTNAYGKTKDYLNQVDNLYISYVRLVEEHGNQFNWGKLSFHKDQVAKLLNDEESYFEAHQQKLNSTRTLEELPTLAGELKSHLQEQTDGKIYKTLATYEIAQTQSTFDEFNLLSQILDRVVVFKLRAGETRLVLANWATEINDIKEKTDTQLKLAIEKLNATGQDSATRAQLERITELAGSAKSELKRSKLLFEEVERIL